MARAVRPAPGRFGILAARSASTVRELRHGLARAGHVGELDTRHDEPEHGRGVRDPVVGVRLEGAALHRLGPDLQAVLVLHHLGAEPAQLAGERGDAVGLVGADVPDAGEVRRRVGDRGEGRQDRGQLADVGEVRVQPVHGVRRRAGSGRPVRG